MPKKQAEGVSMKVKIAGVKRRSFVDGEGVRYVVFFQGCPHNCYNCHNPDTHDETAGESIDVNDLIADILSTKYIDGITLSGGEPFMQAAQALEIAKAAKDAGLNVWIYTGWRFEELVEMYSGSDADDFLENIDVIVDGRYVDKQRDESLMWKGSANQRVIAVKRSLKAGDIIEFGEGGQDG